MEPGQDGVSSRNCWRLVLDIRNSSAREAEPRCRNCTEYDRKDKRGTRERSRKEKRSGPFQIEARAVVAESACQTSIRY
jgi:outer membrane receptor for ferric coprogen and ferric-rhodotorulic acid